MSLADYGVADGDILNLIIKQHDPALHVAAPEPELQPEPQPHEGVPPARGAPILFKGEPPPAAPADRPAFIAAEQFAGARPGYSFQLGDQGLGYYPDAAAPQAAAAEPADVPLQRQMSDSEKQRLIAQLETLPLDAIDRVMGIVREFQPEGGADVDLAQLPPQAMYRIRELVESVTGQPVADDGKPAQAVNYPHLPRFFPIFSRFPVDF